MSRDRMFMLMRFNVMSFALTEVGRKKIADAYLQAWDDSAYPLMHGAAFWHEGYEDDFDVTKDMMENIGSYLDGLWVKKKHIPSVYDLEVHYQIRQGNTPWDRMKIITALRYFYLNRSFDAAFWTSIMSNVPSEGSHITSKYDRDSEVFFN